MRKIIVLLITLITLTSCSKSIEGTYIDSYTNEAKLVVSKKDNNYLMVVTYEDSNKTTTWTMSASLDKNKLMYRGEEIEIVSLQNGEKNVSNTVANNLGYFEIKDGKLYWLGAAEQDARNCIFEKNK